MHFKKPIFFISHLGSFIFLSLIFLHPAQAAAKQNGMGKLAFEGRYAYANPDKGWEGSAMHKAKLTSSDGDEHNDLKVISDQNSVATAEEQGGGWEESPEAVMLIPPDFVFGDFWCAVSDNTVTITRYIGTGGAVLIPDNITGMPVVAIGQYCAYADIFDNCYDYNGAFEDCASVTSVSIPASITGIAYNAFWGCAGLTNFDVDTGNTAYSSQDGVLYNKARTLLRQYPPSKSDAIFTIPGTVTTIGEVAFEGCTDLTSVTIPNSVSEIGWSAFRGCTGLTSVTLPNSIMAINGYTFAFCTSLTSIIIPNSVGRIEDNAFEGCIGLTSVSIPSSVTDIGSSAFWGCTDLTSVTIPNSVSEIGWSAFRGCTGLTSVTLPNSIMAINGYTFAFCTSLTSIIIPNSVGRIEDNAFEGCTALASITILGSLTSIGSNSFEGCIGLTSISIPGSVTSIGNGAFRYCTGLTTVTIPGSVTDLGWYAFAGCSGLTSIHVDARNTVYSSQDGVLYNKNRTTLIQYPDGKNDADFTIPDGVTSVGDGAFYQCPALTSVTIPASVITMYGYSEYCEGICAYYYQFPVGGCAYYTYSCATKNYASFYTCSNLTSAYFLGQTPETIYSCNGYYPYSYCNTNTGPFHSCGTDFKIFYIQPTTTTTTITAETCTIEIFPRRLSKVMNTVMQLQAFIIRGDENSSFSKATDIDWGTPSIETLVQAALNKRLIIALVLVNGSNQEVGDIYDVTVDNCSGELSVKMF